MFRSHQFNKYQGSVSSLSASLRTAEQCLRHAGAAEVELRQLRAAPSPRPPHLGPIPAPLGVALPRGTQMPEPTCS